MSNLNAYWRRRIDAINRMDRGTTTFDLLDRYLPIGNLVWDFYAEEAHFSIIHKPDHILFADALVDAMHDIDIIYNGRSGERK